MVFNRVNGKCQLWRSEHAKEPFMTSNGKCQMKYRNLLLISVLAAMAMPHENFAVGVPGKDVSAKVAQPEGQVLKVNLFFDASEPAIVFAAKDPRTGAAGSVYNIVQDKSLNHQVIVEQGLMEPECSALLKDFFKERR